MMLVPWLLLVLCETKQVARDEYEHCNLPTEHPADTWDAKGGRKFKRREIEKEKGSVTYCRTEKQQRKKTQARNLKND